ncbi:MAG: CreA family protein [Acidocella sp.]|uniref:CreA family protein n=1 Tax=Acidocella sp. TaxID=50710 RepID=UPI003FC69B89
MKAFFTALAAFLAVAIILFLVFVFVPFGGRSSEEIGAVSTNFRLFGPNDKVIVQRFDDPKVANVSCYASFAQTGGIAGGAGVAENPSQFALNCIAHGPVTLPADLPDQEEMGSISASLLFKHFIITRMVDRQTNTLVYVLISTKLLHGSPANAVSAVPASGG